VSSNKEEAEGEPGEPERNIKKVKTTNEQAKKGAKRKRDDSPIS